MRILNGLSLPWLSADGIVTRVGSDPGDEAGTVLDYLVASEQILRSINHLTVGIDLNPTWSDHRPVRFRWSGYETNVPSAFSTQSPERGPMGWRFKGTPSGAQTKIAQERITSNHRLNEVLTLTETSGPEMALYLIMEIVGDAWTAAGIKISLIDGNGGAPRPLQMPVSSWFDDTVRDALKQWHALRQNHAEWVGCWMFGVDLFLQRRELNKVRNAEVELRRCGGEAAIEWLSHRLVS